MQLLEQLESEEAGGVADPDALSAGLSAPDAAHAGSALQRGGGAPCTADPAAQHAPVGGPVGTRPGLRRSAPARRQGQAWSLTRSPR